ncbi:hypothetical protein FQA39_LY14043 [Lamprigera yunnana]|nr:hypothetical protein FQA39_LY14043 [Lamprigera yunnana]
MFLDFVLERINGFRLSYQKSTSLDDLENLTGAPPAKCALSKDEQSCLLEYLIEVINKLIKCKEESTEETITPKEECSVTPTETVTPWYHSSMDEQCAEPISTTPEENKLALTLETTTPSDDETSTISTNTLSITEDSLLTLNHHCMENRFAKTTTEESQSAETDFKTHPTEEPTTTACNNNLPVITNLKLSLPKKSFSKDGEKINFLYIPVLKVDNETKPIDLVNVLKHLFLNNK